MPIPVPVARWLIRAGVAQRLGRVRALLGDGVRHLHRYADRLLASPNGELKATQALVDAAARPGVTDLSLGAPPLLPELRHAAAALAEEALVAASAYPPATGLAELRGRLAERCLPPSPPHPWEVLVCNGATHAIALFLDAFVNPGDAVAAFDPGFFMVRLAAQHRMARWRPIPLAPEGPMAFDERRLAAALRGAKALFVNSPHNPTGGAFDADQLARIAWHARRRDALLFADEVYREFRYAGPAASLLDVPAAHDRLVVAGSFSKSHGMAGWRVGHAAGPRHLIQPMMVAQLAGAPFVSVPAQRLALAALDVPAAALERRRREHHDVARRAVALLRRRGIAAEVPAGAFYLWLPLRPGWPGAAELLDRHGLLVMPGEAMGAGGVGRIRVSFTGAPAVALAGIARLAEVLAGPEAAAAAPNDLPTRRAA